MTPQEVFTTVKTHLLQQGRQAKITDHPEGMCAYHAEDGTQCAAGCLIPANLYHRHMEEKPIDRIFTNWPEVAEHIGPENLKLVAELQELHDNKDPDEWADDLDTVAQEWGLEP